MPLYTPHPRPPLFVRGGPMPDQVPSAKGSGASPDRTPGPAEGRDRGHVVDPASLATSRRRRRAKTDRIDGGAQVRALLAYKRGEPRVCAMLKAPTPHEEDRRRISRERETLTEPEGGHPGRGRLSVSKPDSLQIGSGFRRGRLCHTISG